MVTLAIEDNVVSEEVTVLAIVADELVIIAGKLFALE